MIKYIKSLVNDLVSSIKEESQLIKGEFRTKYVLLRKICVKKIL